MKFIFFIIPILLIGLIPVSFQIIPFETLFIPDTLILSDSKNISVDKIEDGSQIKKMTGYIQTVYNGQNCVIYLKDEILHNIPISDAFQCGGIKNIMLNKNGTDALQQSLVDNTFEFTVSSNDTYVDFIMKDIKIRFDIPSYFAEIKNGVVTNVISADQSFINEIDGEWIKTYTDYNYAGIGQKYNYTSNLFYSDKIITVPTNIFSDETTIIPVSVDNATN